MARTSARASFLLASALLASGCVTGPVYVTKVTEADRQTMSPPEHVAGYVGRGGGGVQATLGNGEVLSHLPGRWATVERDKTLFPTIYDCDGSALVFRKLKGGRFEGVAEQSGNRFEFTPVGVRRPDGQRLLVDLSPIFRAPGKYFMTMNAVNNYLVVFTPNDRRARALVRCA